MSDRSARLKEMQERQEELESNNKRLQQEEQDLREKYHEVWIVTCSSVQPRTKPVEAYYKIPIFCTRPDQKAYRRKMKNRSPPPPFPIPILFVVTPEMHTWAFRPNNFEQGLLGWGGTLFPLEMIVVWREITKHMEMSNELRPGL